MTVEPSWRRGPTNQKHKTFDGRMGNRNCLRPGCTTMAGCSGLIPDTRLQDIADTWSRSRELVPENGQEFAQVITLLDALTKEKT